jgi:hypothetical protein
VRSPGLAGLRRRPEREEGGRGRREEGGVEEGEEELEERACASLLWIDLIE